MMGNYRKKFMNYYGLSVGKNLVVHHIDCDKSHNNIENLVLLPRDIHGLFHQWVLPLINHGVLPSPFSTEANVSSAADGLDPDYFSTERRVYAACVGWYQEKMNGYKSMKRGGD